MIKVMNQITSKVNIYLILMIFHENFSKATANRNAAAATQVDDTGLQPQDAAYGQSCKFTKTIGLSDDVRIFCTHGILLFSWLLRQSFLLYTDFRSNHPQSYLLSLTFQWLNCEKLPPPC